MKKQLYLLLMSLAVFAHQLNAQNILSESFEGTFPPTGWTLVNAGAGNAWTQNTVAAYSYDGTNSMLYSYNANAAANAWAFTPNLALSSTNGYYITFYVSVRSSFFPEQLKFTVGNANTVAAQTTTLLDSTNLINTDFRKWSAYYRPATSGNYNFAFNCTSLTDQFDLHVDSVSIFQGAPQALCAGRPNAGTISGPANICSGTPFTLTNTGATPNGNGVSSAWQSSANGTSGWTNIPGQTSATTATVSQSSLTYYRFVDTCAASSQSAASNVISVSLSPSTDCYCTPQANCTLDDRIDSVGFVTLSNITTCSTNGYGNFTALPPASIAAGTAYPMGVKAGPGGTEYIGVWIDYDRSGTFDANEFTALGSGNGTVISGTINVSGAALLGNTRMRVRLRYNVALAGTDACTTYTYGETEDYTVTITAGAACTGTPSAGAITPATSATCSGVATTLASSASNTGTGITYQWQSSSAGNNAFTNISGATSNAYTATPTAATDYRLVISCTATGLTATSGTATISVSATPANDLVCNAITLTVNGAAQCGNTTCATATGDPAFTASTPNNTVWYSFTPTVSGPARVRFTRPAGVTTGLLDGWLGVYTATGTCPSLTLTQVTGSAGYVLTTTDSILVNTPSLTAGNTYYFMIDGVSGAFGAFCIQVLPVPAAPPCAANITPAANATNVANPVTFNWAPVTGATAYEIRVSSDGGATYPLRLIVTAPPVADVTGLNYSTSYRWYVRPVIGIDTASTTCAATNSTAFTTVAPPAAPANDNCSGAISINPYAAPVNGTTISATQSLAPGACAGGTSATAYDVWYQVTTLSAGNFTVNVTGNGSFDAVVGIYRGTCGSLLFDTCRDVAFQGGTESVTVSGAVAGTTYYIRVYDYSGSTVTDSVGTFTISATGPALPVTGVTLGAIRNGGKAQLGWKTLTEINNAGFEIQRSADGKDFSGIASIASKATGGNSTAAITYNFEDVRPLAGANYYRLKQTDKDGKTSYSNIVYLKGVAVSNLVLSAIYPNPTRDVLKAAVQSPAAESITFIITDMMGKTISRQVAHVISGDNTVNISVANLPSGSYLLKAICRNGCSTAYQKFTKQ